MTIVILYNLSLLLGIIIVSSSIHPPYILHTFTKLERSESEIQKDEREAVIGLRGQD